jgi:hypothetical protein
VGRLSQRRRVAAGPRRGHAGTDSVVA